MFHVVLVPPQGITIKNEKRFSESGKISGAPAGKGVSTLMKNSALNSGELLSYIPFYLHRKKEGIYGAGKAHKTKRLLTVSTT